MRWMLAILILLNAVAFYWFSNQSEPSDVKVGPGYGSEAVGGLLLLSERSQASTEESERLCIVIGPISELSFRQWLGEELSYLGVGFDAWSEKVVEAQDAAPVEVYWLQFDASRRGQLSEQLMLDIQSSSPESKIEEKTCSVVASGPDIP